MSHDTPTPDDDRTDLPDPDDSAVQETMGRLGGLADIETARQIVAEQRQGEETEPTPPGFADDVVLCELCGDDEATELGGLVVNTRAYPASPMCNDCYIPFEDIGLPRDVDREQFRELHENLCETKTLSA